VESIDTVSAMALYYLTRSHTLSVALSICSVLASFPASA